MGPPTVSEACRTYYCPPFVKQRRTDRRQALVDALNTHGLGGVDIILGHSILSIQLSVHPSANSIIPSARVTMWLSFFVEEDVANHILDAPAGFVDHVTTPSQSPVLKEWMSRLDSHGARIVTQFFIPAPGVEVRFPLLDHYANVPVYQAVDAAMSLAEALGLPSRTWVRE